MINEKERAALLYCFQLHSGQTDKQGEPYFLHVVRVAMSVMWGASEDMFLAALLHDVVENCAVNLSEIGDRWGERVRRAVDHLTRRKNETYRQYILRCRQDAIARRVKLADLEDNLRPDRLTQLPPDDAQRLAKRYTQARSLLDDKN